MQAPREFRHFWDLLADDLKLALTLLKLERNHADLFFLCTNGLLTLFETVLLNVALLVVDAKLIITIDKLDAHIVTAFTRHLIFVDEIIHLFLQRVYYQVELVPLVNLLPDD